MIVARDNKWVLYTPPKTGSTSLHKVLVQDPICATSTRGQHSAVVIHDAIAMSTTRHPVTRALSLWKHLIYQFRKGNDILQFGHEPSFNEYVAGLLTKEYGDFFGWPVCSWLSCVKVDYFIKLERFHVELYKNFGIQHMSKENNVDMVLVEPISAESLEILREWGKEDLIMCEYEFDDYKLHM